MFTHTRRDAQFFPNRLKILCAKIVTWRNLHIEGPQVLGVSVQNLCTPALTLATLSSSEKYWLKDKKPRQPLPSSFLPNSVRTNDTSQARAPIRIWTPDYPVCNLSCLLNCTSCTGHLNTTAVVCGLSLIFDFAGWHPVNSKRYWNELPSVTNTGKVMKKRATVLPVHAISV